MRNHGKIDPNRLSSATRAAIMRLGQELAQEPGILKAQVTFDHPTGEGDLLPTVHVIVDPSLDTDWPDYWLGPAQKGDDDEVSESSD